MHIIDISAGVPRRVLVASDGATFKTLYDLSRATLVGPVVTPFSFPVVKLANAPMLDFVLRRPFLIGSATQPDPGDPLLK
jgi:hypothetical protein